MGRLPRVTQPRGGGGGVPPGSRERGGELRETGDLALEEDGWIGVHRRKG